MLAACVGAVMAVVLASLLEYGVHRLMHVHWFLSRKHAEHHRDGWGQGVLGEFFDYSPGLLAFGWTGFLYSLEAGLGLAAGGLGYTVLAAYAHQVQHERPELVFWLPRPVHHLHHKHHMWRHNFGILTDVWDRVFGTYRIADWQPERPSREYPLKRYFQIKWY